MKKILSGCVFCFIVVFIISGCGGTTQEDCDQRFKECKATAYNNWFYGRIGADEARKDELDSQYERDKEKCEDEYNKCLRELE